jgi:predicted MPP superfamily phosphohydrolase
MTAASKQGTISPAQKRVLIWSSVSLVLGLGMNIYFYSLEGAKGLYVWNQTGLFRTILLASFIPVSVAILSFPLEKLKTKVLSKIMRGISLALSVLVGLGAIGLTGFFIAKPRMGNLQQVRIALVNPGKGIQRNTRDLLSLSSTPSQQVDKTQTLAASNPDSQVAPLLRMSFSSDPHWGVETANQQARTNVLASIAEHRPDVFFLLGDTVETGSNVSEWNQALVDISSLAPKVPLRPLMGNHDALFGGQYLFKKAFFPKDFSSDSGSPYYYSIEDEAATIVVLNLPWGTEEYRGAQKKWLEKVLMSADTSKPIIVLSHSFFYASGYDDPDLDKPWYDHYQNIPAISPLFERFGVDLVVSGHNHYQELLEKNGVQYAVVGSMGGKPDPAPLYTSPASTWIAVATFGRLDVDVGATDMNLTFRDEMGETLHTKTIRF